jgi:hypothetical protein
VPTDERNIRIKEELAPIKKSPSAAALVAERLGADMQEGFIEGKITKSYSHSFHVDDSSSEMKQEILN